MQARKHISIYAMFNLEQFEKSSQTMQRRMRMAANKMKSVGQTMSLSISAPIVASMGYATAEFAKFEQSMAKVNAVSGATGSEMGKLTKLAQDLGISTRYTASQVSDLELNYAKLGFTPDQIQQITESTLDLALATGGDLADSAMVAGATLRGFGLEGNEMQRVVDVMAKSFTSSALDLEKFSVSISKIAPIAAVTGRTIEQVAAQQSVLADTGVEASIIGTSLRKIYGDLAKSGMSYNEAMDKIRASTNKVATATKLFDIRAANAAIILSEQEDKVNELTISYENSAGEAKRMAEIMNDTLQMSVIRLKSAVEGLAISFGEVIAPRVRKIADFLADMARGFADLSTPVKKAIVVFSSLLAIGGPVLIMLGSLSLAITAIGAPIAASAVGIVALTASLGGLASYLLNTEKQVKKGAEELSILDQATENYNNSVDLEKDQLKSLFDALKKTNKGSKDRKELIENINKTYGTTLKNLDDENEFVKQLDKSYEDLLKQMTKKIKMSVVEDTLKELIKVEEGIASVIDVLQNNMPDSKSYEAWRFANAELTKQGILLAENKKKQEELLSGTFFEGVSGEGGTKTPPNYDPLGDGKKPIDKKNKTRIPSLFDPKNLDDSIKEGLKSMADFQDQSAATNAIVANGWSFMTESMLAEFKKIPKELTPLEQRLKDFTEQINESIQGMAQDAIIGLADMFGQMAASGDDFTGKDFGKGVLMMLAGFMQQLGGLMITYGLAFKAFKEYMTTHPAIAIAAGIAMVAAGAAIKGTLDKGMDGNGSSSISSPSSYGSTSGGVSFGNQDIVSTVRIEGREMIITQKRENNFRR